LRTGRLSVVALSADVGRFSAIDHANRRIIEEKPGSALASVLIDLRSTDYPYRRNGFRPYRMQFYPFGDERTRHKDRHFIIFSLRLSLYRRIRQSRSTQQRSRQTNADENPRAHEQIYMRNRKS
jgi:hypothetical protein